MDAFPTILAVLVLVALGVVVLWRRGWLGVARDWRKMAAGSREHGYHAAAWEYESNALECERRARPWQPAKGAASSTEK